MCDTGNPFGGKFGAGQDAMEIEILEDGTIKTTTDPISGANHANAEQFLAFVGRMAGGEQKRERRAGHRTHTHHGVQKKAAEMLKLSYRSFRHLIKK